jgi:hypothetical protein
MNFYKKRIVKAKTKDVQPPIVGYYDNKLPEFIMIQPYQYNYEHTTNPCDTCPNRINRQACCCNLNMTYKITC